MVHRPPILILDEHTAGVDIEFRAQIWEYVRKLNENGTTIILTTHYLEEAEELCDKIAILDKGKIVKSASKQDLLEDADSKTISVKVKEIPDLNHPILLELGGSINDKNELTVNFNPKIINSREILSKIAGSWGDAF
jgi:ABC-type multidrug transport system, ATPase component